MMRLWVTLLIFALPFWSFEKNEEKLFEVISRNSNLKQSDSIVTIEHSLNSFSTINVQLENKNSDIKVYLSSNSYTHAEIYGYTSDVQKIQLIQDGEILTLALDEKFSKINGFLEIHLFTPIIKNVNLFSDGHIVISDFDDLNDLQTVISGSGVIKITSRGITKMIKNYYCNILGSGKIVAVGDIIMEDCMLNISGNGDVNFELIKTKKATIIINGSGYVRIRPTESLNGVINGYGRIYYYGDLLNPNVEINGCGEISRNNTHYYEKD